MSVRLIVAAVLAAFTTACAIKPQPEDVTGSTTPSLVGQIKCEAKQALIDSLEKMLSDAAEKGDKESGRKLQLIRQDLRNIKLLKDYSKLPTRQESIFSKFESTIIVFDFQLRMTETNNVGGGSTLARPFVSGLDLIGFKLSDNLERQNFRTFRVQTTPAGLFAEGCPNPFRRLPNYQYPISGDINIRETFDSYFTLAYINSLALLKDWPGQEPFTDTIKFTTTVGGEVNPNFSLTPPSGRGYVIRDASGTFAANRKDEHQLTIGISLPDGQNRQTVNAAVDRAIVQSKIFGLSPLNPYGALNGQ